LLYEELYRREEVQDRFRKCIAPLKDEEFRLAVLKTMQVALYLYVRANSGRSFTLRTLRFVSEQAVSIANAHLIINLELTLERTDQFKFYQPRGFCEALSDI